MHIYTERLKTRSKRSRPSELSEEEVMYHIKKELKESSHGWTTKQVEEELIVKESDIKYHYTDVATDNALEMSMQ